MSMRSILILLLLLPFFSMSQNTRVFIKITDAAGRPINGDAMVKGFEKAIQAYTTSSAGKNNTQFSFTMPVSGAAAPLKNAMSGNQRLLSALVTVMNVDGSTGRLVTSYTIKMENIGVLACSESMGCNNIMTTAVALLAGRIGWTYYQADKSGALSISQKYGWDAGANMAWNSF